MGEAAEEHVPAIVPALVMDDRLAHHRGKPAHALGEPLGTVPVRSML